MSLSGAASRDVRPDLLGQIARHSPGCPPGGGRHPSFRNAGAIRRPGVSDNLRGEEGEAVTDGPGVEETQGLLVAGLAEEALASPEHDREDDQPQLVDQVVLDQRAPELIAGVDDDVPVQLLLQFRDLVHHVALQDRRVVPLGLFEGRGHDVLGQAVQSVCPLTAPGWPPRGEPLVAPPTQQQGLGAQRLVELELGPRFEVLVPELAEPAAQPEALLTVRVLDHSVERDVRADHYLSHIGSPSWLVLSATPPRAAWVVSPRALAHLAPV